jgi:hypothetical protein
LANDSLSYKEGRRLKMKQFEGIDNGPEEELTWVRGDQAEV